MRINIPMDGVNLSILVVGSSVWRLWHHLVHTCTHILTKNMHTIKWQHDRHAEEEENIEQKTHIHIRIRIHAYQMK